MMIPRVPVAVSVLVASAFVVPARVAEAQATADACHAISPTENVVISLRGGGERRGSLLCLSDTEALLAGGQGIERQPLSDVRRIVTRPDAVWDGAAKGAAVPLIIWAIWCRQCDAGPMLRTTATYALIGMTFDALESHRRTLYDGRSPAATVSWRLRF